MFPNSFGLCLLSSFCFGGNKINILDTNVRHILRRCTLPARPLAFPQRLSPLSVKAATSPPPAAAPSRSRSPTSRGHPPRAACAPPVSAAYLPPTCRAGVHARRKPRAARQPPGLAARPSVDIAPPAAALPRSRPLTSRPPVGRTFTPAATLRRPATSRLGRPPFCGRCTARLTRRRHARLHDIHPSQPTIGDHPGKRS